ncbi:Dickkopf N-terminal cysteine-rich domain-containing protein [Streptomyces sp. UNOC14_S4]|uniref:huwentoxin-IV family protein n=1 Tax=Streptomyces sp. UNOC14_S4 TaxID=2872340 RepID=UPI001E287F1C|nr:Dickkopf N-terminal cysteine-rich domain-containing protein [Streptomyces sp. UNOC14_S4]MCC3767797.1 hypothetical protein [Streptomyces sp. UNOC14_S4]
MNTITAQGVWEDLDAAVIVEIEDALTDVYIAPTACAAPGEPCSTDSDCCPGYTCHANLCFMV